MAKAYIKELEDLHSGPAFPIPVWSEPSTSAGDQAPVDFTAGATASAAFATNTKFIVISTDAICSYLIGKTPVATTANFRLPVGTVVLAVRPGDKASFVSNT